MDVGREDGRRQRRDSQVDGMQRGGERITPMPDFANWSATWLYYEEMIIGLIVDDR